MGTDYGRCPPPLVLANAWDEEAVPPLPRHLQAELRERGFWEGLGAEPDLREVEAPEGADPEDEEEISAFASAELNNKDEAEAECWKIADLPEKLWLEAAEAHMLKGTKWDDVVAYVVLRFFIRTGADLDMAADYYHDMYRELERGMEHHVWEEVKNLTWIFESAWEEQNPPKGELDDVGRTGAGGWIGDGDETEEELRNAGWGALLDMEKSGRR